MSWVHKCKDLYKKYTTPSPSLPRLATVICLSSIILALSACVLAFNEPAKSTSEYEVLEPETWVGRKLPILENIDIGKQLNKGTWLVLFYHYDCPDCVIAIKEYQHYAADLAGNGDAFKIAFIEVPPYGPSIKDENCCCTHGSLNSTKEWFIATPVVVLLTDGWVEEIWKVNVPDLNTIFEKLANANLIDQFGYCSFENFKATTFKLLERRWLSCSNY
jgi:hypothetical protein